MEADEALRLIALGEGQNVEFKTSFSEENAAIESLGAFANAGGGTVLIGVKDDSTVCGVNIGANTLENFANNTRTASQPPLYPSIGLLEIDGKTVAAITIAAGEQSQFVYVFNTPRIRVGRSNQVMSPDEQRRRLLEGKESDVPSAVDTVFHELQSASYLIGNEAFSALQVFEQVGHELLPGRDSFTFRAYVAQAFNLSPSNLVDEKPILQHWMLIGIVGTPERVQPVPQSGPDSNVRRPEQPYDRYSLSALGKQTLNEMRKGGTPNQPVVLWPDRAGGPQFRMSPGIHEGRLLCQFEISDASPAPGGIEAKWTGAGTKMDWTKPMRENVRRGSTSQKYQMKPAAMAPTPPEDEVTLEVRFNLEDGQHGGRWTWTLRQHESKGHWKLESHLGSGVHQPSLNDAW